MNFQDDRVITEILPRKNHLIRPPLANMDQLIFVVSVCEPSPNLLLLDKFIAIAEYKKVKAYYSIIRDIESDTDVAFTKYNQYSEANYLNALYLYHYLTGKGFKREVPQNARLTFVVDTRNENNMPIEKFKTDTFSFC